MQQEKENEEQRNVTKRRVAEEEKEQAEREAEEAARVAKNKAANAKREAEREADDADKKAELTIKRQERINEEELDELKYQSGMAALNLENTIARNTYKELAYNLEVKRLKQITDALATSAVAAVHNTRHLRK
jgi:hypothetical protein